MNARQTQRVTEVSSRPTFLFAAVLALVVLACGGSQRPSTAPIRPAVPCGPAEGRTKPCLSASAPKNLENGAPPLRFVENDFPGALARAKALNRPLFVDVWAPWCHTCSSMTAFVFTDERIRAKGPEFVWASIDTEREENAAFLARYPMEVWPTLWVIDPKTERPVLKWLGSATATELASLLEETRGAGSGPDALAAALRAHRLSAEGAAPQAVIAAYRAALEKAPANWPRRPPLVEALASTLQRAGDDAACVTFATAELDRLPAGTSQVNTALAGLECAGRLPPESPLRRHRAELLGRMERLATDTSQAVLDDDRSGLFESLVSAYESDGVPDRARALARRWAEFLERAAAAAPTPAARAVFDAHRVAAYLVLGEHEKALTMLAETERALSSDYNTPHRQARVYFAMERHEEALAAVDRALARAYGPRRMRQLALKADILFAQGKTAEARRALREAVAIGGEDPLPGSYGALRTELRKRLEQGR